MAVAKHKRMRRRTGRRVLRRAALLFAGALVPLGWLLMAPAEAAPQQGETGPTRTVEDVAEAWYASSPIDICTTPLGCPPEQVPTSPYPDNTLHVGVAGGQETARTYVQPDLLSLPVGATALSGVMTLPVDTTGSDGTISADAAKMVGCLVTQPFTDGTAGSSGAAPKTDCKTSVRAVYDAKKVVFTLDLEPFFKAWATGLPSFGIALQPDPDKVTPSDAWHVTINGRKLKGRPHVESVITYKPAPPVAPVSSGNVGTPAAPPPTTTNPPPVTSVPDVPPATTTPDAPAPVVAPTQQGTPVAQQPVAFSQKFQYPMAFLAPLALLIGAVFFTRLFTRDARPRQVIVE